MSESGRIIAHVDMDAFFVEAELLDKPELRGRKVIVAGSSGRSVVLSASYPARADGVRSAMPLSRARQLSPQAVILEPQMVRYRNLSAQIMEYFATVTDLCEQLSVDEAFLDLTGARRRLGTPEQMGQLIRHQLRELTGLPASVGIADRKFLAKIASTRAKPDGLLVIRPEQRMAFLHSLPVEALWGVGAKTAQVLQRRGIRTVEQLAHSPREELKKSLGAAGEQLFELSWGRDPRKVTPHREEKSIGAEETFEEDLSDDEQLARELLRLAHRVASRLRAAQMMAAGVTLKLRYSDFTTITRSLSLPHPTHSAPVISAGVRRLLTGIGPRAQSVRLVGVRADRLEADRGAVQLSLGSSEAAFSDAERTVDEIAQRFPGVTLGPASLLRIREEEP